MTKIDFAKEVGSLIINFNVKGEKTEVVKSDALVIITLVDNKISDIQILLDSREAIAKLSKVLGK